MHMARTASNRLMERPLGPCMGRDLTERSEAPVGAWARHSRYPTARAVRFGNGIAEPTPDATGQAGTGAAEAEAAHPPVASATMDATYGHADYRVTAWQPQGKPAFVFLIAIGERRLLQPNVAEGKDFDEVMRNAAAFVERLLDADSV